MIKQNKSLLRPSFREAISRAERQVEYDIILQGEMVASGLAREVCMIIAEVYMMDPEKPIRISGEWLDGHVVQEVFGAKLWKMLTIICCNLPSTSSNVQ